MTEAKFRCSPDELFVVWELPAWVRREQAAGRIAAGERVAVEVTHPDREMDGSCRWCGGRANETVLVSGDHVE